MSITEPRAAQVWFTNPYSSNPLVLVGPKSLAISKYEDITGGMRIAVPRGSPQDQILTAKAPQATILRFDDDASANQALVSGQADLIGTGILVPPVLNQMNPGKDYEVKITLSVPYMAMAVRPGNINLLNYLNTFLFLQKQNGTLEEISEKYLKIPVGDLPLQSAQLRRRTQLLHCACDRCGADRIESDASNGSFEIGDGNFCRIERSRIGHAHQLRGQYRLTANHLHHAGGVGLDV